MHLVPLIRQPNQSSAHRDHIVVRMRGKTQHAFWKDVIERLRPVTHRFLFCRLAARPANDRALQMPKDLQVDFISGSMICQQILQTAFVVVGVRQLQQRLARFFRQPDHSTTNQLRIPRDVTHQPRQSYASQIGGSGRINQKLRLRMLLQVSRGDCRSRVAFDRAGDNRAFVFTEGQNENPPRFKDGADTHRDGTPRYVFRAKEICRRIHPGDRIQSDHARATGEVRSRFVEPNMTRSADSQNLNVDATRSRYAGLVIATVVVDPLRGYRAVRHVPAARRNVDVIKQVLTHEPDVTLHVLRLHRIIFVQIERNDVAKRQALFAMQANQFGVDARRSRPGGQTQHTRSTLGLPDADQPGNLSGNLPRCLAGIGQNQTGNTLNLAKVLPGGHVCNGPSKVAVGGNWAPSVTATGRNSCRTEQKFPATFSDRNHFD